MQSTTKASIGYTIIGGCGGFFLDNVANTLPKWTICGAIMGLGLSLTKQFTTTTLTDGDKTVTKQGNIDGGSWGKTLIFSILAYKLSIPAFILGGIGLTIAASGAR